MYVRQKCCNEQRDVFMCGVKAILVASSNLARQLATISWRLVVIGELLRESCQQPICVFLSVTFWFKTHTLQLPLRKDWKITLKPPRNRSRNGVKLTGGLNKMTFESSEPVPVSFWSTYFTINSCVPCSPSCQTCYGDRSDQCLSCTLPKHLMGSTCVSECPKGMFHSQVSHTCAACYATCESCSGPNDNDCHSCKGT